MATRIQLRRDNTINWFNSNPILARGEIGVDTDLKKIKIGNGLSFWNDLEYYFSDELFLEKGNYLGTAEDLKNDIESLKEEVAGEKLVKIYNTVAEMQADVANISLGNYIQTFGKTTINDGSGSFYIVEGSLTDGFSIGNGKYANSIITDYNNCFVGKIDYTASSTVPTGYLKANGAGVSRTTYANLFSKIGTTCGPGDGSTTFNLPDLRGEFIRGWDDGRGVDSGRVLRSWQDDMFEAHNHISGYGDGGNSRYGGTHTVTATRMEHSVSSPVTSAVGTNTSNTGGTETRPRNIALMAVIKY